MSARERQGMALAALLVGLMVCLALMVWMERGGVPDPVDVAPQRPRDMAAQGQAAAVASVLSSQDITTTSSQSSAIGAAYYREATGYVSTTVTAGYITYTWQSSADNVAWFDQWYMAGINASQKITVPLGHFGSYLRLSWTAMDETSVTGTVWVSFKE